MHQDGHRARRGDWVLDSRGKASLKGLEKDILVYDIIRRHYIHPTDPDAKCYIPDSEGTDFPLRDKVMINTKEVVGIAYDEGYNITGKGVRESFLNARLRYVSTPVFVEYMNGSRNKKYRFSAKDFLKFYEEEGFEALAKELFS